MRADPTCPRCGGELRAPGLWSSAWQCLRHGGVLPFALFQKPGEEALEHVVAHARVPVWMPFPLPAAWVVSGLGYAGDERSGGRAVVVACSGPSPLAGGADLVLVAEEPGIGLGARYAGLSGPDPGDGFDKGPPDAKVEAAGHPTALWSVPSAGDAAAFVGEAKGLWLWAIVYPGSAGVLMYDAMTLTDLRDHEVDVVPSYGTLTPRLTEPPLAG